VTPSWGEVAPDGAAVRVALDLTGLGPAADRPAVLAAVTGAAPSGTLVDDPAAWAAPPELPPGWDLVPAEPLSAGTATVPQAVRAARRSGPRRGLRLVTDGRADACVLIADAATTVAAAGFAAGLLPGAGAPVLARTSAGAAPRVLVSAWPASPDSTPGADLLATLALAACWARLVAPDERAVGVLDRGTTAGVPADPASTVGTQPVTVAELVQGTCPSVVVTDPGLADVLAEVLAAPVVGAPLDFVAVLGVAAVTVGVAPGVADAAHVAQAVGLATAAGRAGLLEDSRRVLADVVAVRRARAGLPADRPGLPAAGPAGAVR
jgi:hypothetical protein